MDEKQKAAIIARVTFIDNRDLYAFFVYSARERSLDASLRAAQKYGRSEEHKKSISALRDLNFAMLRRESKFSGGGDVA
jgi:hypothetical protein